LEGGEKMKKILLAVLFSVFLLSAMTVPALSQDEWTVGLSVGDSFKYKGTLVLWEGNATFPPLGLEYMQTYNESDWIEWTVTDIEGLNVTCEVTTHWTNGTETVATITEDITSSFSIHMIAANLTEGTELRPETTFVGQPMPARYLNASIMREYESGSRETNVLIYDWHLLGNVYHLETLFDKETGMHVYFQTSLTDAQDFGGGTYSCNGTFELIETNLWECAQPQDEWTVGVSVGDWFKYEGTVEWEADEGVPFPPNPMITWLVPFNGTDWFRFNVTDVSGTLITVEALYHWKDGTNTTGTFVEDISSSSGHFIGANMEVGDELAPSTPITTASIIDETVEWEYDGITREINHAWMDVDDGTGNTGHLEWWYDKATGIQLKLIDNSSAVTAQGNATWVAMAELVETNLWVIPEFPTGTAMLLTFVAVTVCVDIYRRKKLKHHIG
jgi:hypothetical protein